jgi:hypothetical protein
VTDVRLEGRKDDGLDVALEDSVEELSFRRQVNDQKGAC